MTQTGYTNAIVNTMLGWLKTVAGWFLRFFNLYNGASPIEFLMNNWAKILVILLIVGIVLDVVVWLFRWRPHWVWFGKKRVVITDRHFFAREDYADEEEAERTQGSNVKPKQDWVDNDFVVKSKRPVKQEKTAEAASEQTDVFSDENFNVDAKHRFTDCYEDEVFNVEDLPESAERTEKKPAAKKKRKAK